jgi:superfamily I DNA and/or RNA helicase
VIYSMTTSTHADAPRGMGFLYSLNRLNVATSRAKCLSILTSYKLTKIAIDAINQFGSDGVTYCGHVQPDVSVTNSKGDVVRMKIQILALSN